MIRYVPVLRLKAAERYAVRALSNRIRQSCTPLIEIVPADFLYASNKQNEKLKRVGKRLDEVDLKHKMRKLKRDILHNFSPGEVFIDFILVDEMKLQTSNGEHPLSLIANANSGQQISLLNEDAVIVPTTGLNRSTEYNYAVSNIITRSEGRACIRLFEKELFDRDLEQRLMTRIASLGTSPPQVDLIVNFSVRNKATPTLKTTYNLLPNVKDWRTLTIVSGSYPVDLQKYQRNDVYEIPRTDFTAWSSEILSEQTWPRIPDYGDYTLRPPVFKDSSHRPSASILYTTLSSIWKLYRGELPSNEGASSAKNQYQAHAKLLCNSKEYFGKTYSMGDSYFDAVKMGTKYGYSTGIIRAGINHHITVVVNQLATLSASLTNQSPASEATEKEQPLLKLHE